MSKKTKQAECIECGEVITISLFASAKKARCDECKKDRKKNKKSDQQNHLIQKADDDISTIDENTGLTRGARIDGRPNKALENLSCPYHPDKKMKLIGVIKDDMWGDIVTLQCREEGCWLVVEISEQSRRTGPLRTKSHGIGVEPDLPAEEVKKLLAEGKLSKWWEGNKY